MFHDIVSGRRRGIGAAVARVSLAAARYPYAAGVFLRNRRFDHAHTAITRVSVPVISVGNITLGGTGKTPMVAWLASWLGAVGRRPAIVSRGYGAAAGVRNDEALELERQLDNVPHLQNPDRVAAAQMAIDKFECDVILLDDGFQHRRLHRDLDIVLLDALCPFGYGRLFPSGMLREPLSALRRADAIVLTRADLISAEQREWIRAQVAKVAAEASWTTARHAATRLVAYSGAYQALDEIRHQDVAAFCGIGNPRAFRRTLTWIPVNVVAMREFPDHHRYTFEDLNALDTWVRETNAPTVVCTLKDLVKIDQDQIGQRPLWGVEIKLEMVEGEAALVGRLRKGWAGSAEG